jgi:hypothetical protein
MTDYEYIITQCRKYHFTKWDDEELRKCVDKLAGLPRQELTALYYSRWVKEDKTFRESVFNTLFKNQVGKREERIKNMSTEELIAAFREKEKGNVSLIRMEMRDRYKAGRDKQQIAMAFNYATKSDQQWVKWQIRKERYGNPNNNNQYHWKKRF